MRVDSADGKVVNSQIRHDSGCRFLYQVCGMGSNDVASDYAASVSSVENFKHAVGLSGSLSFAVCGI